MTEFMEPDNGMYPLHHLTPTEHTFAVTVNKTPYLLPITVIYRDHCYTRAYEEGVHDPKEIYLPNTGENRVFCPDRWKYSHGLPTLMESLIKHNTPCYAAAQNGLYFKIDKPAQKQPNLPDAGWYLFFKIKPRQTGIGIAISVESSHERSSWPSNAKSRKSARLRVVLTEYLNRRPELLAGLEAQV